MNRAIPIFAGLLAIALPLSLLAGRVWLDPASTPNAALILAELRLPRAVLAIVVFIPFFRRGRLTSAFEYLGDRFGPGRPAD